MIWRHLNKRFPLMFRMRLKVKANNVRLFGPRSVPAKAGFHL
jgi:hypothetical protein